MSTIKIKKKLNLDQRKMKTSTTILTTVILLIGVAAAVYVAQRPQQMQGRAEESVGDFDGNGTVDSLDYNTFLQLFERKDTSADLDKSGQISSLDLNLFLSLMER